MTSFFRTLFFNLFIFGLHGSAFLMHMLPYLKSFHCLPVEFRIESKILLTHKRLRGYAPTFLKIFINSFEVVQNLNMTFNKVDFI